MAAGRCARACTRATSLRRRARPLRKGRASARLWGASGAAGAPAESTPDGPGEGVLLHCHHTTDGVCRGAGAALRGWACWAALHSRWRMRSRQQAHIGRQGARPLCERGRAKKWARAAAGRHAHGRPRVRVRVLWGKRRRRRQWKAHARARQRGPGGEWAWTEVTQPGRGCWQGDRKALDQAEGSVLGRAGDARAGGPTKCAPLNAAQPQPQRAPPVRGVRRGLDTPAAAGRATKRRRASQASNGGRGVSTAATHISPGDWVGLRLV
jgi:hypothetical protein